MHFLLIRQKSQAELLVKMLEVSGHTVKVLPVIAIKPPPDALPAIKLIEKLHEFEIAIFISANAVHESAKLIEQYASLDWHSKLAIAAIGPGTKNALAEHNWQTDIISHGQFNSEGLLAEPGLQQVKNKKIVIFRGVGGRELLATSLANRGARVSQAVSYERTLPELEKAMVEKALKAPKPDATVVMSNESLNNLYSLAGAELRDDLLDLKLVVISERCASLARDLQFKNPAIIATSPEELSLLEVLNNLRN